jgi:peptide/nickel transport system permease protein
MGGRGIGPYVGRRLLMLVPIALAITLAVFLLASLIPGGAVAALLNGRPTSDENIANLRAKYGLDKPLVTQYWDWLSGVVHGDLGRSFRTSELVSDSIKDRFSLTVMLNSFALILAVIVGVPLGTWAAMRRGRSSDRTVVGMTVFGSSAPSFVVALLFLWAFAQKLGLFPLFGAGDGSLIDRLYHLTLPAIVMAIAPMALVMKITRASMLDQIGQDHIAFARARGLSERRVIIVYGLRNALIPVLTAAGLLFVGLLTGTVFVETVFGLPGLGSLLISAVRTSDLPVIQGLALLIGIWIVIANLLIDLTYALVDPRVDFARRRSG